MLGYLSLILSFTLVTFILTISLYPGYIRLLKKRGAGKNIRDNTATGEKSKIFKELHQHKAGTPTMGGGLFLVVMLAAIAFSLLLQHRNFIDNSLRNQQETYIILF